MAEHDLPGELPGYFDPRGTDGRKPIPFESPSHPPGMRILAYIDSPREQEGEMILLDVSNKAGEAVGITIEHDPDCPFGICIKVRNEPHWEGR